MLRTALERPDGGRPSRDSQYLEDERIALQLQQEEISEVESAVLSQPAGINYPPIIQNIHGEALGKLNGCRAVEIKRFRELFFTMHRLFQNRQQLEARL
jgi:hypothetical protein